MTVIWNTWQKSSFSSKVNLLNGPIRNVKKFFKSWISYSTNVEKYRTSVPIWEMHSSSIQRTSESPPHPRPPPSTSWARRLSASRSQTCNVTVVCHLLETALDKEWASQPELPWKLGSKLCVVGHFQAFMRDRQSGGSFVIKEQNVPSKSKKKNKIKKKITKKKKVLNKKIYNKQNFWNKLGRSWGQMRGPWWGGGGTGGGRARRSAVWVNRAIWPSIIRDADDWSPVIEIPKANIDSSWSRRSFGLWHTPLLQRFLPPPSLLPSLPPSVRPFLRLA